MIDEARAKELQDAAFREGKRSGYRVAMRDAAANVREMIRSEQLAIDYPLRRLMLRFIQWGMLLVAGAIMGVLAVGGFNG